MISTRQYTAEGAITAYHVVKAGSSDTQVAPATAVTDRLIGVYVGPSDAIDTGTVEICVLGECYMAVAGAISRGMTLTVNGSSQGVNANPASGANNRTIATALQSGTDTNIAVFVERGWMQGA